jgi:hypothetical protein
VAQWPPLLPSVFGTGGIQRKREEIQGWRAWVDVVF